MAEVRADITATVWQVVVVAGQDVREGDTLVVLESMKMEIPVVSPVAGVVGEVRVGPRDQVREGDVLVVVQEA